MKKKKKIEGRKKYIYSLSDPITKEPRYIGQAFNVERRVKQHLGEAGTQEYLKAKWLYSLWARGLSPVVHIVETVELEDCFKAENKWIKKFKNLTNGKNPSNFNEAGGRIKLLLTLMYFSEKLAPFKHKFSAPYFRRQRGPYPGVNQEIIIKIPLDITNVIAPNT